MCPLFHIENTINGGDSVKKEERPGGRATRWDQGKDNDVVCILILLFYFFVLFFLYGFCGRWEGGGSRSRERERGESDILAGRRQKEGKKRKQSSLIACSPSHPTHTTSTRPVSDNLYC